jgi:hypothetical protein
VPGGAGRVAWCGGARHHGQVPIAPDLRRLTRIALAYVLIWVAMALYGASQAQRVDAAFGREPQPMSGLPYQLATSLVAAVFTPVVVAIGERLTFRTHKLRDALLLALSVVAVSVLRAIAGGVLMDGMTVLADPQLLRMWTGFLFHAILFDCLMTIALTRLVCTWNESRRREQHAAALTATLTRARLDELRTRLQSGFLTQTLRTIGQRIRAGDPEAEALIVGLSDLLRHVLALARRTRTTLEEDLDLLDRYLEFHGLLSGRRIDVRYEFDQRLLSTEVPLLMLQPLFDEAVTGARSRMLHITIRGRMEEGALTLEVEDDAGASPRTAIDQVRERVRSCLAGARLAADTRAALHTTRIDLPFAAGAVAP